MSSIGTGRRPRLPGAAELFRTTGSSHLATTNGGPAEPGLGQGNEPAGGAASAAADAGRGTGGGVPLGAVPWTGQAAHRPGTRRRGPADRSPTGREKHEEKITVYVSGAELVDLERARLTLRSEFGLAVDRGRIVREALAVVLADLDGAAADSVLVRRLQGR